MRNIVYLIIFTAIAFSLSCQPEPRLLHEVYGWEPSVSAEFDSVMLALQDAFYKNRPGKEREVLLDRLCSIGNRYDDGRIRARMAIWRSRMIYRTDPALSCSIAARAIKETDKSAFPQEYNYLLLCQGICHVSSDRLKAYSELNEALRAFRAEGDSIGTGYALLYLSFLFNSRTICPDRYTSYCQAAINSFSAAGFHSTALKLKVNFVLNQPDTLLCITTLKELLSNPVIKKDSKALEIVRRNLYPLVDSLPLIDANIDMLADSACCSEEYGINLCLKGMHLANHGDVFNGISMLRRAYAILDSASEIRYRLAVTDALANFYAESGRHDSACVFFKEAVQLCDRMHSEYALQSLIAAETELGITRNEGEIRLKLQHVRTYSLMAGAFVLIVLLSIGFMLYRRSKAKQIRRLQLESQLRQKETAIAAHALIIEEKNNFLNELRNTIGSFSAEGKISSHEGAELEKRLKIHSGAENERTMFLETHSRLYPDFVRKLKSDFPELTENQLRLASYIAAGISNKQIARMLNITPGSVKTNRYRLRIRLHLKTDDSLEDFLRHYIGFESID